LRETETQQYSRRAKNPWNFIESFVKASYNEYGMLPIHLKNIMTLRNSKIAEKGSSKSKEGRWEFIADSQ
jgi:hypothetical protein